MIDGSPPFLTTHAEYFPLLPLQVCRVHASRRLDHNIAKARRSPDAAIRAELKDRVRGVLFAATREEARDRLAGLLADRERYAGVSRRDTLVSLERLFGLYMTHHRVEGMPPDTNVTENVIEQLSKKIRLLEGFATMSSAETFSRLLVGCYRFKRFTDSGQRNGNGRSPLELGRRPDAQGLAPIPPHAVVRATQDVTLLKLLTPERRRRAVVALVDRFGVSERRACTVTGQCGQPSAWPVACGAPRACAGRLPASASAAGPRAAESCSGPSAPTTSGPSTSSSTRPPITGG